MAYEANYGRGDMGQFSPYRDTAKRRHSFDEEEEQQPQDGALAQAIYPQQAQQQAPAQPQVTKPVFSKQKTQPLVEQVQSEAAAGQRRGSSRDAVAGPAYTSTNSQGKLTGASNRNAGAIESAMGWDPSQKQQQEAPAESALAKSIGGGVGVGSAAPGGSGYTLTNRGGAGGGANQYTGFDFGQSEANRDTGKSAKYAFADLAAQSGVAMPTTKEGAEAWFRQYIEPGMSALGHEVLDVKGDKALIRNWQGEGWVDFLVNADGANPQLAWQAEGGGGAVDPLASAVGGGSADPVAQMLAQQMGIDTSNPLWKQILDQLIADQSGDNPPMATIRV